MYATPSMLKFIVNIERLSISRTGKALLHLSLQMKSLVFIKENGVFLRHMSR